MMRGIWNFVSKTQLARNPLFQLRTKTHRDSGKPHEQEPRTLLSKMRHDLQRAEDAMRQAEEEKRQVEKQIPVTFINLWFLLSFQPPDRNQRMPETAISKLLPNKIRKWITFPQEQLLVWKDVFATNFVLEGHFTSLNTLSESGDELRQRSLGSEIDLVFYQGYVFEDCVSAVIRQLYSNKSLRNMFNLSRVKYGLKTTEIV